MNLLGTNSYKIIHGDAIEALKNEIEDNSVDLIFADPPYNIGKNFAGCIDNGRLMINIYHGVING